jgi:hypothetical protein
MTLLEVGKAWERSRKHAINILASITKIILEKTKNSD